MDGSFINAVDAKERVREYHEQVNQKRRLIHQKKMEKKKLEEEQNPGGNQGSADKKLTSKDAVLGNPS
jgi:hypothetical protein